MVVRNVLEITNSRFWVCYVEMKHFEAHLMVSLNVVDTKLFRMTIQLEYFSDKAAKQRSMPIMFSPEKVTISRTPDITIFTI